MKNKNLIHIVTLLGLSVGSFQVGRAQELDVTIQGQADDKVKIERVIPAADVPLRDVVPFSRIGQTDWILSEDIGYLDESKQIAMMGVNSPKVFNSTMIEFPKPPYFIQSYPPPPKPILVDRSENAKPLPGENETWSFLVIDQNNNVLKKLEGVTVPAEPVQWDGVSRGNFVLKTDEVYSSLLIIKESDGNTRTIVGDPVRLPALRYIKGNQVIFEFSNRRIYIDGQTTFAPPLGVLISQLLNELRKNEGNSFEVSIQDKDLELSQRRAGAWRKLLEKNLLRPADSFNVRVGLPIGRGPVTRVVLNIEQ